MDDNGDSRSIPPRHLAILGKGDAVRIKADQPSRLLLVAGKPFGEPIARHGPFVMNTPEEIDQAYQDYSNGLFGSIAEDNDAVA